MTRMTRMIRTILTITLCGLFSPALFAEEQLATILQQTSLRAAPYSDARALTTLRARQRVRVIQRKGGWYQVRSGSQPGWLRMSHLRLGSGSTAQGDGTGLSQTLRFLSTGRSGASGVTVATGIRGLDATDVANAQPNHQAVAELERFYAHPERVRQFARDAKLQTQPLGYVK